jgi:hypothetical protein
MLNTIFQRSYLSKTEKLFGRFFTKKGDSNATKTPIFEL